jgi:hypothetical protein
MGIYVKNSSYRNSMDGVGLINLAADRNNWQIVVNRVMNEVCALLGCFSWFY